MCISVKLGQSDKRSKRMDPMSNGGVTFGYCEIEADVGAQNEASEAI